VDRLWTAAAKPAPDRPQDVDENLTDPGAAKARPASF
jgi:hypothetical protein